MTFLELLILMVSDKTIPSHIAESVAHVERTLNELNASQLVLPDHGLAKFKIWPAFDTEEIS